jgi:translation initiation factor IF-3
VAKINKGSKEVRVNERIRVSQVRVIDENGQMVGVLGTRDAILQARERGFDLVEVSPGAVPPVCRIMDYGKYKYEISKKAKKAKRKQHVMQLKEIKMRPGIESHDYDFKMKNARRFLEEHNKVKFSLIFRGREVTHLDIGMNLMKRVSAELAELANIESGPRREGMNVMMVVGPKPGLIKKTTEEESDEVMEEGDVKS